MRKEGRRARLMFICCLEFARMGERTWRRVTTRNRCPVCGKADYCMVAEDGSVANCMRVEGPRLGKNKLGGWLHRLADPMPLPPIRKQKTTDKPKLDWTLLARTMFEAPTAGEERNYLAKTLGLKESALVELHVGRGWDEYRHKPYSSWPERDASGKVVGIVRRYRDGAKKTMQHSSHGLYIGPLYMPGPVLLPEGGSDSAALVGLGLNVIGRPSNTGGVDELVKLLKKDKKPVVVLGERDKKSIDECHCGTCMRCWPGLAGALLTAQRLIAGLKRHVSVKMFKGAKDAREWVNQHPDSSAPDVLDTLYKPDRDCCRVCGNAPPHEERLAGKRIEVLCRECRSLLENKRAVA